MLCQLRDNVRPYVPDQVVDPRMLAAPPGAAPPPLVLGAPMLLRDILRAPPPAIVLNEAPPVQCAFDVPAARQFPVDTLVTIVGLMEGTRFNNMTGHVQARLPLVAGCHMSHATKPL